MTTLQLRVDEKVKQKADSLFNSLGMDTSTAIRIFLNSAIENNGIPFAVQHKEDYSLLKAMNDSRNMENLTGPFDSAEKAVASMLED